MFAILLITFYVYFYWNISMAQRCFTNLREFMDIPLVFLPLLVGQLPSAIPFEVFSMQRYNFQKIILAFTPHKLPIALCHTL